MPTVKKRSKIKKKTAVKLILIGMAFLAIFIFFDTQLKPTVTSMSSYYIKQYASNQINSAVNQAIGQSGADYDDIVSLQKGSDGKVVSIQTKAQKITLIHTKITKLVNEKLSELNNQVISIPLGSLSGITFLSGRGPMINIKTLPRGSASSEISSKLEDSGINQTLHTINAKINVQITSIIPLFSTTEQLSCDCMIAQSVIVGAVPNYYTKVISQNSDVSSDISKYGNPRFSDNNYQ